MGIKELFLKTEPSGDKPDDSKTQAPTKVEQTVTNTFNVGMSSTQDGVPDEKYVSMLFKLIEDNNIPGQDYFEFKKAIQKMSNLSTSENDKIQMVYSILSDQGCTKEVLLSSIDKYIQLIEKERKNFQAEFGNEYKKQVELKLANVEKAKAEVEQLNKKISELNNFILTETQTAQQADLQLKMSGKNFEKSADVVIAELNNDKFKINTLIK